VNGFHSSLSLPRRGLIDLGIRSGLGLIFAFSAGTSFSQGLAQLRAVDLARFDAQSVGGALAVITIGLFSMMIACLYAIRMPAIGRASGAGPIAAALLGSFLMYGLLLLDRRTDLPLAAQMGSCALVISGNVLAIYSLSFLGRSFSILPESRRLVTSGPYRLVRHPVYLAEELAMAGAMIQFFSAPAVLLLAIQIAFQIARIHYEESVLRAAFPEYEAYRARTSRLIPRII